MSSVSKGDGVTRVPYDLLDPEELRITSSSTLELLTALADGRVTSVAVTSAFLRRAAIAQKLVSQAHRVSPSEDDDSASMLLN
jgi:amidase